MNKKFFRNAILSFIITTMIIGIGLPGSATILDEKKEVQYISPGVTHEHIQRFTTSGWRNINVLRVDLTNPYSSVKGIINPGGLSNRSTVSNLVNQNGAVAGINGDYFSYSPVPHSIGTLINDGEVISSPIEKAPYAAPSIFLTEDGKAVVDYMDRTMRVTNLTRNISVRPYTLNRLADKYKNITMLNRNWGAKSIGNRFHSDLAEVVVENDIVTDVRINQPPANIPYNGYVLLARGDNGALLRQFKVGDNVEFKISTEPNLETIKFAIGGGSIILKDGTPTVTNIHSAGAHPRTGIGVNKDSTELILVTLDGRSGYKGMLQKQFGGLMKELGAHNALNLDGGGSTTMAVKGEGDSEAKVVNRPSDGSERRVVNGVGIFKHDAPVEDMIGIEIKPDGDMMFAGTNRRLSIKGYDRNRNEIPLDMEKLEITQEGVSGEFTGTTFKADHEGIANITAKYGEFTDSCKLEVLGEIQHLDTYMTEFGVGLGGNKQLPNFNGYDGNGNMAKVYLEDVELSVINDIGHIESGVFYGKDTPGAGAVSAKAGNGIANILVTVGEAKHLDRTNPILPNVSKDIDIKRRQSEVGEEGFSIGVAADPKNLNSIVKYDAVKDIREQLNKHEVSVFLGGARQDFANSINSAFKVHANPLYKVSSHRNVTFMNLNTKNRGLVNSETAQWNKLKNDLKTIENKNIIITTTRPIFGSGGFSDQKEAEFLHNHLVEAKSNGKNIFVVSGGSQSGSQTKNGIRYITLNTQDVKTPQAKYNMPILEFVVNGNDITYTINPLFKK